MITAIRMSAGRDSLYYAACWFEYVVCRGRRRMLDSSAYCVINCGGGGGGRYG